MAISLFLLLALGLLSGGSSALVWWGIAQGQSDAVSINLAGSLRMLSQRITKDVLLERADAGRPKQSRAAMDRYALVVQALRTGSAKVGTTTCPDAALCAALDALRDHWEEFQEAIARGGSAANLDQRGVALLNEADKLTKEYQRRAETHQARLLGMRWHSPRLPPSAPSRSHSRRWSRAITPSLSPSRPGRASWRAAKSGERSPKLVP
mgnify:CR=1 FL=1